MTPSTNGRCAGALTRQICRDLDLSGGTVADSPEPPQWTAYCKITRPATSPVRTWLRLDQLRALWSQERLAASTWHGAVEPALVRVLNDADLARRYRSVAIPAYLAWRAIGDVAVIARLLLLARVGLVVLEHLSTYWPTVVGSLVAGVVAVALYVMVDQGWDLPFVWRVVVTLAFAAASIVALIGLPVVVLGLLGYVWWCIALLALAAWLGYQFWLHRRRRRAPREIAAVLAADTGSG